jgi:hypothetical protein
MLTGIGGYFSIAVVEDGAPERRLPVRFSTRAEADAAVERLGQSGASRPGFGNAVPQSLKQTPG